MSRAWRLAWELAFVALAVAVLAPLFVGRVWQQGDLRVFALPDLARFQAAPFPRTWEPGLFCGYPVLAGLSGASLYPPHLLLRPLPLLAALGASFFLHAWMLARGSAALVRDLGGSRRAGLLAATTMLLGGSWSGHVLDWNVLVTLGWTPWVLLLAVRSARNAGWLDPLLLAGAFGLSLLHTSAQWALYAVLMAGLLALATRPAGLWRVALGFAAAGLLAAPIMLPAAEYIRIHGRARGEWFTFATALGASLEDVPGWFVLRPIGAKEPFLPGLVAWGLAGFALVRGDRRAALWKAGLLLLAVGLFLAPGGNNPVFRVLVHLPPLRQLRCPGRILLLAQVGLALLAAHGLDRLLRATSGRVRGAAGAALLAALALQLLHAHRARTPALPVDELLRVPPLAAPILRVPVEENRRLLDLADHMATYEVQARRLRRNTGLLHGVEYVSGYESLPPAVMEACVVELARRLSDDPAGFADLCARLSIRWVVLDPTVAPPGLVAVADDAGARLWEHPRARPLAYLLPDGRAPAVAVRFERPWPGAVRLPELDCDRPSRLVVATLWYPGWVAEVDGAPADLAISDTSAGPFMPPFLELELPAGRHAVELRFESSTHDIGLRLGAAAWVAWLGALALLRRRA